MCLSLNSELKPLRSKADIAAAVEQGVAAPTLTGKSSMGRYEGGLMGTLPPTEPRPVTGVVFANLPPAAWAAWCARASWWDWRRLIYLTSARGAQRAHFNDRPKVAHV